MNMSFEESMLDESLRTAFTQADSDGDSDATGTGILTNTHSIPAAFLKRERNRTSHVWLPENGEEITGKDGKPRWKYNRCKFSSLATRCGPLI